MSLVIAEFADTRCPLCHRVVFAGSRHECSGGTSTTELPRKPVRSALTISPKKESGIR